MKSNIPTRPGPWLILWFGLSWLGSGQTVVAQSLDGARSPDQHYEWRVRTENPVRYELTELPGSRVLATVKDYFWDQDQRLAAKHARAAIVCWDATSSLVALDEFNYRRAGRLWVFWLKDNQARPVLFEGLIKPPIRTTEKRFCLAQGWRSPTQLSIRLAGRLTSGEVVSKAYLLDLDNPTHPKAIPQDWAQSSRRSSPRCGTTRTAPRGRVIRSRCVVFCNRLSPNKALLSLLTSGLSRTIHRMHPSNCGTPLTNDKPTATT